MHQVMTRATLILAPAVALILVPMAARAQGATLVSAADIEHVTGLAGVHLVPGSTAGAVPGEDNFADASGRLILFVHEFPAAMFARAKAQPAKTMNGIVIEPKLFHAAVPGLGDEAFDSPDGAMPHALYVRHGTRAFSLTANIVSGPSGDRPTLSLAQLRALAKFVISRH